jgi:transcriptional regulator with XRE-family HTH domain
MTIGEELKIRRKQNLMTIEDLSKKSGISQPSIGKIEREEGNYNIDTLITLFEALEREVVVSTKRINKVNQ